MIHRIFLTVAIMVATLASGCETAQQLHGSTFGAGARGNQQVQQGYVVRVESTTISGESGVDEPVAGGAAGAAVCAGLTGDSSREMRAAASAACGAIGSQAGRALSTKPRPASEIVVRLESGEPVSVLQESTAAVQPGTAVFIVRRGASTHVVRVT